MPSAPQEILDLVATFKRNERAYTSSAYNEAQVRSEFIDKLFIALGWDISNRANNAPQYREVITESQIQSGAGTPGYTFRIGSEKVYFVEAKKPQVDVGADGNAARARIAKTPDYRHPPRD